MPHFLHLGLPNEHPEQEASLCAVLEIDFRALLLLLKRKGTDEAIGKAYEWLAKICVKMGQALGALGVLGEHWGNGRTNSHLSAPCKFHTDFFLEASRCFKAAG